MKLINQSIVCRDAVELFSDYLDGALPPRQRRKVERHLEGCDACRAYLAQLQAVIADSARTSSDDLAPEVLDGLIEMFRKFQQDD